MREFVTRIGITPLHRTLPDVSRNRPHLAPGNEGTWDRNPAHLGAGLRAFLGVRR